MIRKKIKKFILDVIHDIFYVSLTTFLVFSLLELVRNRFITAHINMNMLLILVIVTGIITVIDNEKKYDK